MILHLLNDRTALALDDKRDTVTVSPETPGVMVVEGHKFPLEPKGTPNPCLPEMIGAASVGFTDEAGRHYRVVGAHFVKGVPLSSVNFTNEYVHLRLYIDHLDRKNEELHADMLDLRATVEPDSLGFLNIGGNEK